MVAKRMQEILILFILKFILDIKGNTLLIWQVLLQCYRLAVSKSSGMARVNCYVMEEVTLKINETNFMLTS